jgi:hypothetical protein
MLQGLQREGYRPVTVGTCLGDPKENVSNSTSISFPYSGTSRISMPLLLVLELLRYSKRSIKSHDVSIHFLVD